MSQPDKEPEWEVLTRRTILTATASTLVLVAGQLLGAPLRALLPHQENPVPSEDVPPIPAYSGELPPGVKFFSWSQRQAAGQSLRNVEYLLEKHLSEKVYSSSDKVRLEQIHNFDDGNFTMWFMNAHRRELTKDYEGEYWSLTLGPEENHTVQIERKRPYFIESLLNSTPITHIQAQLDLGSIPAMETMLLPGAPKPEIREDSLDAFLEAVLRLPSDFELTSKRSGFSAIRVGITPNRELFRAYTTYFGLVGILLEGPTLTPPETNSLFYIPEIYPEGIPGGIPKG